VTTTTVSVSVTIVAVVFFLYSVSIAFVAAYVVAAYIVNSGLGSLAFCSRFFFSGSRTSACFRPSLLSLTSSITLATSASRVPPARTFARRSPEAPKPTLTSASLASLRRMRWRNH
jgi:hypothetical protein